MERTAGFKLSARLRNQYRLKCKTAYVVNSAVCNEVLNEARVKKYLDIREKGQTDIEDLNELLNVCASMHLVTVADDTSEDSPVLCGCKGFQKLAQCKHASYICHLENIGGTDLSTDFNQLPANKKKGRKSNKSKSFGNCLQRDDS